jgi:hypothetical protein
MAISSTDWSLIHTPALGVLATISVPAIVGARVVVRGLLCSIHCNAAAVANFGHVVAVRDGATGVGVVMSGYGVTVLPSTGDRVYINFGDGFAFNSKGNQLTIEFDNAVANCFQTVNAWGHYISG